MSTEHVHESADEKPLDGRETLPGEAGAVNAESL